MTLGNATVAINGLKDLSNLSVAQLYSVYLGVAHADWMWRRSAAYGVAEPPTGHATFRPLAFGVFEQRVAVANSQFPGDDSLRARLGDKPRPTASTLTRPSRVTPRLLESGNVPMNALISMLRALHCRSTHHYFAIDALPLVQTDGGKRLAHAILRHHDRYLRGTRDPDLRFRDFQNHVVHVTDGYWGGAPRVAHLWYDRLQKHLRLRRYGDAAHAAGVLSHYFTDPMMPLHTQQCDREKVLHRPIEWSINQSYDEILQLWRDDQTRTVFNLSGKTGWLGEAILHGARFANRSYDPLLDTYDLDRARLHPPDGLGVVARRALSELFGLAITGWARVLERAARDAESSTGRPIKKCVLSKSTASAAMRIPTQLRRKRIEHRAEQEAVSRLVSEFQRSGKLIHNLPIEVDIVHRVIKVYDDERESKKNRLSRRRKIESVEADSVTSQPTADTRNDYPATIPFAPRRRVAPLPMQAPARPSSIAKPYRLSLDQSLINAPSMGKKTAERFTSIGVHSVGDFLNQSAPQMANALLTYWITADTITQWQWQAKLMCEVPGLLARECQLIAGSGYHSAAMIATCDPEILHREVSTFSQTSTGRRYLRGADLPKLSDVQRWIADAQFDAGATTDTARQAA